MDGEVLGRGDDVGQVGVRPLHALDEGDAEMRGQVRVFAIGFLPPAPARVAEDVDIGRPGVQPRADMAEMAGLTPQRVQGAHLGADRARHVLDQRRVEAGGQADRFGEVGGRHRAERAVQRFGPPVVGRDVQARNRGRDIDELADLFVQRHLRHQRLGLGVGDVAHRSGRGRRFGLREGVRRRHGEETGREGQRRGAAFQHDDISLFLCIGRAVSDSATRR